MNSILLPTLQKFIDTKYKKVFDLLSQQSFDEVDDIEIKLKFQIDVKLAPFKKRKGFKELQNIIFGYAIVKREITYLEASKKWQRN